MGASLHERVTARIYSGGGERLRPRNFTDKPYVAVLDCRGGLADLISIFNQSQPSRGRGWESLRPTGHDRPAITALALARNADMRRDLTWPKGTLLCLGLIITTAAGCRSASKVPGLGWLDRDSSGAESALTRDTTPYLPPPPSATGAQPGASQPQVAQAQVPPAYQDTGMQAAMPASYQQGAYGSGSPAGATASTGTQGGGPNGFYGTEYPGSQAGGSPSGSSQYGSSPYGGATDSYRTADASAAGNYGSGSRDSGGSYDSRATQLSPNRSSGYTSGSSTYSPTSGSTPYGSQPASGQYPSTSASGDSTYGTPASGSSTYGTSPSAGSSTDSGSNWGGYETGAASGSPASSSTGTPYSGTGSSQPAGYTRPADPFLPGSVREYPTSGPTSFDGEGSSTIPATYQPPATTSGYDSYTG